MAAHPIPCVPQDALNALDRVNTAIIQSASVEDMLPRVLAELLDIFDCDRALLIYPGQPDLAVLRVRAIATRPGFELGVQVGEALKVDRKISAFLQGFLKGDRPVALDSEANKDLSKHSLARQQYGTLSQLVMPLHPVIDDPWVLSIHHCRIAVTYDRALDLFALIGSRIAEGLRTHLSLRRLRESEQRYRALVDHAAEAIVIFDAAAGRFVDANPAAARLYGMDVDTLVRNHGPVDLSPPRQPDGQASDAAALAHIAAALAGERPVFEWVHLRADGTEVPCEISLTRFPDPERALVRGTMTDITGRKAAERQRADLLAQLAQAQKLETIGQMTGGVAHDFNNLLAVILGNLEILRESDVRSDQRELIEAAITATMRGADLTRKMLSYARRAHLEPATLDLNALLAEMDNWIRRTLPANIEVTQVLAPDLWPVEADRASSESALLNLCINARDAMPAGGKLRIESRNQVVTGAQANTDDPPPGRYVVLSVSDTGGGIPGDLVDKVFDPFFTTKQPGEGSGLGLSMVQGFMEQSGGAARLRSCPEKGTEVSLYFPVAGGHAPPGDPGAAGLAAPEPGLQPPGVRVLLAEDQPEVAGILQKTLSAQGFEVVAAPDGETARRVFFDEGPFDLLVSDIVMPGPLQGPALAKALRRAQPGLPVVFLTGYAGEDVRQRAGQGLGDIWLTKPVSRAELSSAVRAALRRARG